MVVFRLNMSTTRNSSSESEESLAPYRTPETSPPFHGYDRPAIRSFRTMARDTHKEVLRENRTVIVVVKDAHDLDGSGMLFTLGLYAPFKNVFDTFKAHTCTTCRDPEKIRFKADGKKLAEEDTPRKVRPLLPPTPKTTPCDPSSPFPLPSPPSFPYPPTPKTDH